MSKQVTHKLSLQSSIPALKPIRWIWLAGALYLLLVTTALYVRFAEIGYDDPYITYRYARNLAQGIDLVYNPGERVLSTTTPLFALLLGLLYPFQPDLPHLANLLGAFSLALGAIFLWDLGRQLASPAVGWVALLLYPVFPLLISTSGSETPLYLAFCLGAFVFYMRQRYGWAAAFCALAFLTRYDGALVGGVILMDYLLRNRRLPPWRIVLVFLGLTLPWLLFAWVYYGSPLPATLAAKQHQGMMASSPSFVAGFWSMARAYGRQWHYRVELGLGLLGLILALRDRQIGAVYRRWLPLLAWTTLYFVSYILLGVSRYFWYYAPLVPGFIIMVGLGVEAALRGIRFLERKAGDRLPGQPRWLSLPNLGWILVLVVVAWMSFRQISELALMNTKPDGRTQIYRAIAEWLYANTSNDADVGTLEVGVIGYYSQRPIIDFAGLIQPAVAARLDRHTTYADAALWAAQYYQPDYLVLHDGAFPRLEQEYVAHRCQPAQHFPAATYGYNANMTVYVCP